MLNNLSQRNMYFTRQTIKVIITVKITMGKNMKMIKMKYVFIPTSVNLASPLLKAMTYMTTFILDISLKRQ